MKLSLHGGEASRDAIIIVVVSIAGSCASVRVYSPNVLLGTIDP
jgi:hypothetical protein